jgi:hypothetical protein
MSGCSSFGKDRPLLGRIRGRYACLALSGKLLAALQEYRVPVQVNDSCQAADPTRSEAPSSRRAWLLAKALEVRPLNEALELARIAEAFISGHGRLDPGPT